MSIDLSVENSQKVDANSLLRIIRLQRMQRLTRITRIFKLFTLYSAAEYGSFLRSLVMKFDIPKSLKRLLSILVTSFLCVHLFSCFYYLTAKLDNFSVNTFVARKELLDHSKEN